LNGQSTDETVAAAERLGSSLGLRASILPRWGELQIQAKDGGASLTSIEMADPTGVDMERVASAMRAIDNFAAGRLALSAAPEAINTIAHVPPAPTWLFTFAAYGGNFHVTCACGCPDLSLPVGARIAEGHGSKDVFDQIR